MSADRPAPPGVVPDDAILAVDDVSCWFALRRPKLAALFGRAPEQALKAVDGVSFSVKRGSTFSIVGESGCGKSTLARLVVGLYQPTGGSIRFGDSLHRPGHVPRAQMIFQDPYASLNPRWRVDDIVAEPIRELKLIAHPADVVKRVASLLELVGLARTDGARFPHEFSGGQRQRISIARALATEAEFLVCDEPTSALDVSVQAQVLNLMKGLQAELGLTYLFISHNLAVVRHVSDTVAVMYLGRFVETAPAEALFAAPRHPYTRLLLDTIPDMDAPKRDRVVPPGEAPNPIDPPSGCPFHPRCDRVDDRCRAERPALTARGSAQVACHHA